MLPTANPSHQSYDQPPVVPQETPPPTSTMMAPPSPPTMPDGQSTSESAAPEGSPGFRTKTMIDSDEREDPYVAFTTSKIPNQMAMANSSIPFGVMFSPLLGSGEHWAGLGNKTPETTPPPQVLRREPSRCGTCGAYVNRYVQFVDEGSWTCNFCGGQSAGTRREYVMSDLKAYPELRESVVDWQPPGDGGFSSLGDAGDPSAAPVMYLLDATLEAEDVSLLQPALIDMFRALPPATPVGLLTYGHSVSVYDLSRSGVASADVVSGAKVPSAAALYPLLYGPAAYLAPLHSCLPIVETVVSSLRAHPTNIPAAERARCLAPALTTATAILSRMGNAGGGRIVVIAGGHPSYGPGGWPADEEHPHYTFLKSEATKHLQSIGEEARAAGIAIDVLAGGQIPVGAQQVEALTKASGGALILHSNFGAPYAADVFAASSRSVGAEGVVDLRATGGIAVRQIIGPAEALSKEALAGTRKAADAGEALGEAEYTVNAVQLHTVEAQQGLVYLLHLVEDLPANHVYFQLVLKYRCHSSQGWTMRVVTKQLGTCSSPAAYLQSLSAPTAAIVLGKSLMVDVQKAEGSSPHQLATKVQKVVANQFLEIARTFGPPSGPRGIRQLPRELGGLAERMYHLIRGPMLGPAGGHFDERRVLHSAFLAAAFPQAEAMLFPRLYQHAGDACFSEVPAVTLALDSRHILLLDHGTDIFTWVGMEVGDEARDAALLVRDALVAKLSACRFPTPRCLTFKEATSQARFMLSRIMPLHKDSPGDQEVWYPMISMLPPADRQALRSKFLFTDDPSFKEWMLSLPILPTQPDTYTMFMQASKESLSQEASQQ